MLSLPPDPASHLSAPRDKRVSPPMPADSALFSFPRWPWPDLNQPTMLPPEQIPAVTWWEEPPAYAPSWGRAKNDYSPTAIANEPVPKQRYHPYGREVPCQSQARWPGPQPSSLQQDSFLAERSRADPFQSENGMFSLPPLERARQPVAPAGPAPINPRWSAPDAIHPVPQSYRSPWRSPVPGPAGPSTDPRSELPPPAAVPEGQTPTEFVRVLQTWIQVAPAVTEKFPGPAGQPEIRPAEGSIILSRQVALGQGTVSFALEYTERPRIPLAQLQLDMPKVKQAGRGVALPIVHRFALPDVVFLPEGDRTVARLRHRSAQGAATPSHDETSVQAVACIKYQDRVWITGWHLCAIVKLRMECFGRKIINMNKFLEGIYSDLRTLRSNGGSVCEAPRSPFLSILSAYDAVNTRKQQRVYTWSHVNHDRLFVAQLDRELDREMRGAETVSVAVAEPALSFPLRKPEDRSLLEQVGLVPRPGLSLHSPDLPQKQLEALVLCHQPGTD